MLLACPSPVSEEMRSPTQHANCTLPCNTGRLYNGRMARSYNRIELIGNLTRDPELRYTPTGTAVCGFGLATNRKRTNEAGEREEETAYHRIVAWEKLAELCAELLVKGRRVFVEGRLAYRSYTNQDGIEQTVPEIIIHDMLLLDAKPERVSDKVPERLPAGASAATSHDSAQDSAERMRSKGANTPSEQPTKRPAAGASQQEDRTQAHSADEIADAIPF